MPWSGAIADLAHSAAPSALLRAAEIAAARKGAAASVGAVSSALLTSVGQVPVAASAHHTDSLAQVSAAGHATSAQISDPSALLTSTGHVPVAASALHTDFSALVSAAGQASSALIADPSARTSTSGQAPMVQVAAPADSVQAAAAASVSLPDSLLGTPVISSAVIPPVPKEKASMALAAAAKGAVLQQEVAASGSLLPTETSTPLCSSILPPYAECWEEDYSLLVDVSIETAAMQNLPVLSLVPSAPLGKHGNGNDMASTTAARRLAQSEFFAGFAEEGESVQAVMSTKKSKGSKKKAKKAVPSASQ